MQRRRHVRPAFCDAVIALPAARVALTFLFAFSFLIQAFISQTHLHAQQPAAQKATSSFSFTQLVPVFLAQNDKAPSPAKDNFANCPACQAVVSAGAVLASSVVGVAPPTLSGFIDIKAASHSMASAAPSYSWQSRGPPRI